jgi:hypothetical protein
MKIVLTCLFSLTGLAGMTQSLEAKKNIENLCGCFHVVFKYAETFSPDPDYKFHNRDEISAGIELVLPVVNNENKMVLQHLLVISDSVIIKHWREDWTYESPVLWKYNGNKRWTKESLSPEQSKGKWTQGIWEVSDAPRYQGASEWVHTDGKTFWQNSTDAPLPRREYSVRSDYNILRRTNRLILTDSGWIHEQDNQKMIRSGSTDKLLVEEKGINSYTRVDQSKCAAARNYWNKNEAYWKRVRDVWEDYAANNSIIELKNDVNGKQLHDYLFALAKEYNMGNSKDPDIEKKIKSSIESFLINESSARNF